MDCRGHACEILESRIRSMMKRDRDDGTVGWEAEGQNIHESIYVSHRCTQGQVSICISSAGALR
jgi:hypothetical protein